MGRPSFALYALFPDRDRPTYVVGGFTPPEGTTPEQAAGLRWFSGEAARGRTLVRADDRFALYEEVAYGPFGRSPSPQRYVAARYDDLGMVDAWGQPHHALRMWPDHEQLRPLMAEFLKESA